MQINKDEVSVEQWAELKSAHEKARNVQLQGRWWLLQGIHTSIDSKTGTFNATATLLEANGPH